MVGLPFWLRAIGIWLILAVLVFAAMTLTLDLWLSLEFGSMRGGLHRPLSSINEIMQQDFRCALVISAPLSMIVGLVMSMVVLDGLEARRIDGGTTMTPSRTVPHGNPVQS